MAIFSPGEQFDASKVHEDIKYTEEDDKAIDDWISGKTSLPTFFALNHQHFECVDHVETTWHSLGE